MFGIDNDWYLVLAIAAAGLFIVTLGGVHIWSNLPDPKSAKAKHGGGS